MSLEVQPKHTKLTKFLCQELLYEYALGRLEPHRQRDVEIFLETCWESKRELENLKKGLTYAKGVSEIEVSSSLYQALLGFEPQWKKRLQAWTLWSSQRGWKLLPYVFLLLAIGLGLSVTQPWRPQGGRDLVLVEQKQTEMQASERTSPPPEAAPPRKVAVNEAPASAAAPTAAPTPPSAPPPALAVAPAPTPVAPSTATAKSQPVAPNEEAEAYEAKDQGDKAVGGRGWLYRGQIFVNNFAEASPALRDKIIELDGKAAGSVDLGWLRRPDEAYFHFSLPESNFAELEALLKTFGPVRITKQRHPRVMPAGQIRIILTLKDGENHEGAAEAP